MKIRSYWFIGTKDGFETNDWFHPESGVPIMALVSEHFLEVDECFRWLNKVSQAKREANYYVYRVDVTREMTRNL